MKINSRKYSPKCYLNINGKAYEQWADLNGFSEFQTLKEYQDASPTELLISRKNRDGYTRIYRQVR